MENARDTLGGNCAVAESAFPTAPWTPPQAAPTGTTGILLDAHLLDSTSVDGSNPAICGHRKSGHFGRPETAPEFYFKGSCTRKDV